MAVFYPFPAHIPLWQGLGSTLLIAAISIAVIVMAKRLPYLFVGWTWYAITILPVIKIVQVGNDAMADRYHYLPSVGIAIGLAWCVPLLLPSEKARKKILFPMGIIFLGILSFLAWRQCGYWKNSNTLFSHALQVTKNNYLAHINYGAALFSEGKIGEAFGHYNEAIRLKPYESDAYNNRGAAYANLEQYQKAFEDFNESIRLNPNNTDSAMAYNNRGVTYARLGQYQKAIDDLNKAIYLKPDYANAYYKRGLVYKELGQYQRAVNDLSEAIHLKQDYAESYDNRAIAYFNTGKVESGCQDAKKSCELGNCSVLQDATGKGLCR
jgi:tetratricopeptide (TPR) repeat protein